MAYAADFEYFRGVGQVGCRRPCESERVDRARRRRSDAVFADGTFFDVRDHDRDGCDRAVELLPAPDSHSGALKARRKRWGSFTDHVLSIILLTPLVGRCSRCLCRASAIISIGSGETYLACLGSLLRCRCCGGFSPIRCRNINFTESFDWIPSIGAKYTLGIDGISFVLILLTVLLGAISILSAWSAIKPRKKEFYILFLILQTGMLGVFMSLDFFLFYVFWEFTLVPMYFLIGVWGSDRRLYAAIKFFLYTLAGSVLMLLAILGCISISRDDGRLHV